MSGDKVRILVVDDSATERFMLTQMLVQAGYEVDAASDADEALRKARELRPALVVMDVVMPGMNGFQATRALARQPETQGIPVILCTSKDGEADRVWGLRQGAAEYLTKPVVPAELLAKIAALL